MRIIYNSNFKDHKRQKNRLNGVITYKAGYEVNAYAVIGINGNVTIEASNDDFATTVYSNVVSSDSIVEIDAITAQKWRITASAGITIGQLYIGNLINIRAPKWPYAFEQSVLATDKQSVGGVGFSKIHYKKSTGLFSWGGIQRSELPKWRSWYDDTNGFRGGYILEAPFLNEIKLVRSPSQFPLVSSAKNNLSGSLKIEEIL